MTQPNWNDWPPTRTVTLWQAAALVQDIDPDSVGYREGQPPQNLTGAARTAFTSRLDNVIALATDPRKFETFPSTDGAAASQSVLLAEFYDHVATSTGWSLPEGLTNQIPADPG